jgi:crossover junction endodeoxyribonuclease RuvC
MDGNGATSQPRIMGVDPGLRITGYAVVEAGPQRPALCEAGVVRSRETETQERRIAEIFAGIEEVVANYRPAVVVIEQLFSAGRFPRTALIMAHVRGVICLAAAQARIPVVHYTATRIKKLVTGSGRAPKEQMQQAIQAELRLRRTPEPPDVADALALALGHYHAIGGSEWNEGAQDSQSHEVAARRLARPQNSST